MRFSSINILDELDKPEYAALREQFHRRAFSKGAILFQPEERDNLIFAVISGKVRLYLAYADKEFTVGILQAGDIYTTHGGTFAEALEEGEMLVSDVDIVRQGLLDIPEFTQAVVRVLGHMMRNAFGIIENLAFRDTYARLCDFLVKAAESGTPENGGVLVDLGLTVEQIAQIICTTRQTVSTLKNGMIRDGLLEKRGRGVFFLPDPGKLAEIAGS